jgi:UDP-N-acetylglucosamine/UDP-N-acetylgalactosamine 4-epimerase
MIKDRLIQRIEGLEKQDPIYRDFRVGDVRHSQANIDKAQTLLDPQPKYMISERMDETMDWYVSTLTRE